MFERFTDRARNVLVLANGQANQLGHNYIGTEHILLGLVLEGGGVAGRVLLSFQITDESVRAKVNELTAAGQVGAPARPAHKPPFTPLAKKALELSLRHALSLQHNYIGTEHILMALSGQSEGLAARILVELGAEPDQVRDCVLATWAGSDPAGARGAAGAVDAATTFGEWGVRGVADRHWSPAMEPLMLDAGAAEGATITTSDLLGAMVRATASRAGRILAAAGLSPERLAELLAQVPVEGTTDLPSPPVSISVQDKTTVVEDPEVARFLLQASPEEIRDALRRGLPGSP